MDDKIIATFCLCDDLLKAMHHQEDRQCQMNDAEIMTTAFIASLCFRGNHESARAMLQPTFRTPSPNFLNNSGKSRKHPRIMHRLKQFCTSNDKSDDNPEFFGKLEPRMQ